MSVNLRPATVDDAPALAALHTAVADELTRQHGRGAWSSKTSEEGALLALRTTRVLVAYDGDELIATLRLTAKKPWAIDTSYFTPCTQPLYLLAMAVTPPRQGTGLGRECLAQAVQAARDWPADALRLDAYDAPAGAGGFYARCGWTEVGRIAYRGTPLVYFELVLS